MTDPYIHPSAVIEPGVSIGPGTSVWDNVHIRRNARIGSHCIIGDKTHVAYDVRIGDRVKIGAFVNICPCVTIDDGVMIAMGTVFTNDRFPRATTPNLRELRPSDPDDSTLSTRVHEGATLGAGVIVGPGLVIGRWAMIGMGALLTRSVPDFHLVIGAPARSVALVCRCGQPFLRFTDSPPDVEVVACPACSLKYSVKDGAVVELTAPT